MAMQVLQAADRASSGAIAGVLRRAAIALNSRLSLGEVLDLFAHEILAHTDAQRASLFLCLDAPATGRVRLWPAASLARTDDPGLARVFRSHAPVALDPAQLSALSRAEAIQLPRARQSRLIPPGWAERFDLASVVLVPLFAAGRPCGLLAADYTRRDGFDPAEVELLEALADVAGVAIRNARLFEAARERARLHEVLSRATAGLAPPLERAAVADRLAGAVKDLLHAEVALTGFLDRDGWLRPLAVTGGRPLPAARPLDQVPGRIVGRVEAEWRAGVTRACVLPADPWLLRLLGDHDEPEEEAAVGRFVLLPLLAGGVPAGAVLAGLPAGPPLGDDTRTAAEALASIGGTALERRALLRDHRRRLRRLEDGLWLAVADAGPTVARNLPEALHRVRQVAADLPHVEVQVEVVGHDARLPLRAEQSLYRVARRVLAAAHHHIAGRGGLDAPVTVRLRSEVGRRHARLTVTVDGASGVCPALDDLRPQLEVAGGGLTGPQRVGDRLSVQAWLPRHPHARPEHASRHRPSEHAPYGLTSRERDVLELLVLRLSNPQIARRLGIGTATVRTHVSHLLHKLEVPDRVAAGRLAVAEGLVATRPEPTLAQISPTVADDTDGRIRHGGATAHAPFGKGG